MKKVNKKWGYKLIEEVKKRTGIKTDYEISKAIGISRGNISCWKKGISNPDGETTLKLCILGNINGKEASEIVNSLIENNET